MTGKLDQLAFNGSLVMFATCEHPENAIVGHDSQGSFDFLEGKDALSSAPPWMRDAVKRDGHLMVLAEPNGFVMNGLNVALNLLFGVGGPPLAIATLIVAKSSTAVAVTDTSILGGATAPVFSGDTQNAFSKVLATPAPVATTTGITTVGMTFTQADLNGGGAAASFWPINRIGLTNVAAATNGGLIDVIGNVAAQADPYSRTFSVDFSSAGTFTMNPQITITGVRRALDFPAL